MFRRWRQHKHSQTIAGLTFGSTGIAAARWHWPEGGIDWDIWGGLAIIILAIGVQGVIRMLFCEATKEEDPPLL